TPAAAAAHRWKAGHVVARRALVARLDVALVDGEADVEPPDRRLLADERLPEGADGRSRSQRALLARSETLAQRGEVFEVHPHAQPRTSCTMCPSSGTSSLLIASSTAALEPGSDAITVRLATPATAPGS